MSRNVASLDVGATLNQIAKLLRNDAATRQLTLDVEVRGEFRMETDINRFRLVVLAILLRVIDVMQGGTIFVTLNAGAERLDVRVMLKPTAPMPPDAIRFTGIDAANSAFSASPHWPLDAARTVARMEGGDIEIDSNADACTIDVRYHARKPAVGASFA